MNDLQLIINGIFTACFSGVIWLIIMAVVLSPIWLFGM